jgi:hypothetical protein
MSVSKQSKERKSKKETFKEQAKLKNQQEKIPKSHLIPLTEWKSTDILDVRGDLLEALEQQMVLTYQELSNAHAYLNNAQAEFQKAGRVMQMIMQENIKAGKIKLEYQWNNGEDATPEDVQKFEVKMAEIRAKQKELAETAKKEQNASKTGLVGPGGQPIGTDQDLEGDRATGMANEAAGDLSKEKE